MHIRKIVWWNLGLIMAIALYGIVTDELYWRDNGHSPWLYDYFFWAALAINGPSGFLADYLSWLTSTQSESRYVIQYAFWCLLLWPQWRLYGWLAGWRHEGRKKQIIFHVLIALIVFLGGIAAYEAWLFGHRPTEFFVDKYFWFVRLAGVACSGIVILLYAHLVANRSRSNYAFNADTPKRRAG